MCVYIIVMYIIMEIYIYTYEIYAYLQRVYIYYQLFYYIYYYIYILSWRERDIYIMRKKRIQSKKKIVKDLDDHFAIENTKGPMLLLLLSHFSRVRLCATP